MFLAFFSLVSMTVLMVLALVFTPSEEDFAQSALERIFLIVPRITSASLLAYLVSQLHDVWAFAWLKRRLPAKRFLWIRNNASTLLSQLLNSVVFTLAAFAGIFDPGLLLEILVTTYLFKVIAAVCDTPFLYLASIIRRRSDL